MTTYATNDLKAAAIQAATLALDAARVALRASLVGAPGITDAILSGGLADQLAFWNAMEDGERKAAITPLANTAREAFQTLRAAETAAVVPPGGQAPAVIPPGANKWNDADFNVVHLKKADIWTAVMPVFKDEETMRTALIASIKEGAYTKQELIQLVTDSYRKVLDRPQRTVQTLRANMIWLNFIDTVLRHTTVRRQGILPVDPDDPSQTIERAIIRNYETNPRPISYAFGEIVSNPATFASSIVRSKEEIQPWFATGEYLSHFAEVDWKGILETIKELFERRVIWTNLPARIVPEDFVSVANAEQEANAIVESILVDPTGTGLKQGITLFLAGMGTRAWGPPPTTLQELLGASEQLGDQYFIRTVRRSGPDKRWDTGAAFYNYTFFPVIVPSVVSDAPGFLVPVIYSAGRMEASVLMHEPLYQLIRISDKIEVFVDYYLWSASDNDFLQGLVHACTLSLPQKQSYISFIGTIQLRGVSASGAIAACIAGCPPFAYSFFMKTGNVVIDDDDLYNISKVVEKVDICTRLRLPLFLSHHDAVSTLDKAQLDIRTTSVLTSAMLLQPLETYNEYDPNRQHVVACTTLPEVLVMSGLIYAMKFENTDKLLLVKRKIMSKLLEAKNKTSQIQTTSADVQRAIVRREDVPQRKITADADATERTEPKERPQRKKPAAKKRSRY